MYYLRKVLHISSAHWLPEYEGPCNNLHGHNWNITVYCKSEQLDDQGMVIDFCEIKKHVMELDHKTINKYLITPTAENMARYLCDIIPKCYCVDIEETDGSEVTYEKEYC